MTRTHDLEREARGMNITVTSAITRPPVFVTPETTIRFALDLMDQLKIGSVVVVAPENNIPVGIFTLRDVLARVAMAQPDLEAPIRTVMTPKPVTMGLRTTVHQVALMMARRKLRHVLITDDLHQLIGIISKNDLHDLMCASCVSARNAQRRNASAENGGGAAQTMPRSAIDKGVPAPVTMK